MKHYRNVAEVMVANRAAGYFFFEADTMRFFRSRVLRTLYGGRYFITSEQFRSSVGERGPRKYTVRVANADGSVDTVGEHMAYGTRSLALAAVRVLLAAP